MKAVKDRFLELVKNIITSGMYAKHDIEINRKATRDSSHKTFYYPHIYKSIACILKQSDRISVIRVKFILLTKVIDVDYDVCAALELQ